MANNQSRDWFFSLLQVLFPALYIIKALLTFSYGIVMYQDQLSAVTRVSMAFVLLLIMNIVTSFDGG